MTACSWQPQWLQDARCAIDELRVWRGVETQHISATMQLVDTADEQDLLEQMLEESKPPLPPQGAAHKHYLLTTPFRYTPQTASRFRSAGQRGLWYGARQLRAACAEVAYWRMMFILDSAGLQKSRLTSQHTFFAAHVHGVGINLQAKPWPALRTAWVDGQSYAQTHRLARAARSAEIQIIQYESVRSPGDTNFAVFTPDALDEPPGGIAASEQAWICSAGKDHVLMWSGRDSRQRFEWTR